MITSEQLKEIQNRAAELGRYLDIDKKEDRTRGGATPYAGSRFLGRSQESREADENSKGT